MRFRVIGGILANSSHSVVLWFSCVAPLPNIQIEDAEDWLREVAAVAEQMTTTLGVAVGTLFVGDPRLSSDLEVILELLGDSSNHLEDWIYSAAFEAARQVLVAVRAYHPNTNLWSIVRPPTGSANPQLFLQEVVKEAEYAAGVSPLQDIVKRCPKAGSS